MATFTINTIDAAETTLSKLNLAGGSDNFAYNPNAVLYIDNKDAGSITVNLLGDGQTSESCPGYGDINVSAGKDIVVAVGDTVAVRLASYAKYLGASGNNVVVTTTGATDSEAWIVV